MTCCFVVLYESGSKRIELTADDLRDSSQFHQPSPEEGACWGIGDTELTPSFVPSDWIQETVDVFKNDYENGDTPRDENGKEIRRRPMVLARCSRGGKTRSLKEIGQSFKKSHSDCLVIYVSFNDYSCPNAEEMSNPLEALCLRIAFEAQMTLSVDRALKGEDFSEFRKRFTVTAHTIEEWIGRSTSTPCLLLIDELNSLIPPPDSHDRELNDSEKAARKEFYKFLKDRFLSPAHRYFVCSSHVVGTVRLLSKYLDNESNREIYMQQLPLICNMKQCEPLVGDMGLDSRTVLYYGCIPGLIYERVELGHAVLEKVDGALSDYMKSGVNNEKMKSLLFTFLHGDCDKVPVPFVKIMNAKRRDGVRLIVEWIPYYMHEILKNLMSEKTLLSKSMREIVGGIVRQFNVFLNAEPHSGKAWEALFVIVLLIRAVTCHLPLHMSDRSTFFPTDPNNVSYRRVEGTCHRFQDMTVIRPESFPHLVIYHPSSSKFEVYDVLVAWYARKEAEVQWYGYQLKEGGGTHVKAPLDDFTESYLIRGKSPKKPQSKTKWVHTSDDDVNWFFGESGKNWTPKRWQELRDNQVEHEK